MDRDYELQTHRAEDRHWWYRGRRSVLERVVADLHLPARARILDAGCGSGRNMVEFARHGEVTGIELSPTSVGLARERGAGEVVEGSVLEMPFEADAFDLAASLDVIEHLEDDLQALRELRRVVAPGGSLLVTVPAYQWLWSGHDEINHHHRRYTRRSLQSVGEQAGWQQVRTTYFNSLLLPAAIALRVLDRFSRKTTESSLDLWVPPAPVNWLLERPLAIEAALIGRGGRIPAGTVAARACSAERVVVRPRRVGRRAGVHAKGPGAVDEERDDRDDHRRAGLTEQLLDAGVVDEHEQQALVERQPAALHDAPAHRRQRVADMPGERPAAVEQKAVDGADDEADRRGGQVPHAEDLQQHRVDGKCQQRVGHADDAELDELHEHRRAQAGERPRQPAGCSAGCVVAVGEHSQTG